MGQFGNRRRRCLGAMQPRSAIFEASALQRKSFNCSAMASPKTATAFAADAMLGFDGEADGETALTGVKREFANLDEDDEELHLARDLAKKICASRELSSDHTTNNIFNLRSSLKDRDHIISALKASLDATKGELEKWTSGFSNDYLRHPGDSPDPAVAVQALQKLRASESQLKEQLLTAKRREGHLFMTLATTEQEVADLKKKLQAAENRVKLLTASSPYFQQQAFQEGTAAEMTVPDISYPPIVVPPPMSQQAVHQEAHPKNLGGVSLPPLEAVKPQDIWEVQPRRPREPTEVEKRRAAERAINFRSSNPFVIVAMKPSQVYNGFSVNLRSTALPSETGDATLLDSTGKSWMCKWLVNGSGKRLSAGWKRFALEHELEESDVLVFEVVSRENLTLLVHIFRVELDDSTVGLEEKLQYYDETASPSRKKKRIRPSRAKAGWLFLGRPPPNPPEDPTIQDLTTGVHSGCQSVNGTNVVPKASSQKTSISVSDFQYPVPLPPRRPVTMEERRRAELTARTLKTTNPCVMVVLTKSSVQCHFSLTIPSAFAKQWLPRALVGVTLRDSAGQNSTARWAGNRKSPCLKGFKAFALTHYLEEGDVLVFELTDSNQGNPVFLVHVFRVVELSNSGFTSQESDKDGCPLLTDSENDSDSSKSRQNGESNIGEGASATPNHGKGFCADVLPLATRVPKAEVFNECPVSGGAATLTNKHFKTGSLSHPPEDEMPGK